jgi:hypothetical protein
MNKTEQAYANLLETRKLAGEILGWRFEAYKLRLADNTYYTPDFQLQLPNGEIQLHETKACRADGSILAEDDAMVKIKVAAELYPEFQFCLVGKERSGKWREIWLR